MLKVTLVQVWVLLQVWLIVARMVPLVLVT